MKKIIVTIIVSIIHTNIMLAQSGGDGPPILVNNNDPLPIRLPPSRLEYTNSNYYVIELTNNQGVLINQQVPFTDVQGTPYFNTDWTNATIITKAQDTFYNVPIKMNLQSNKVYYKKTDLQYTIVDNEAIRKIIIPSLAGNIVFANRFTAIDNQNYYSYYQVLTQGTYTLLCYKKVVYTQHKNDMSGEITNTFEPYNTYYIQVGESIKKYNPKKDVKEFINPTDLTTYNNLLTATAGQKKGIDQTIELFKQLNSKK